MLDPDSVARRNTSLALYGRDDVGHRKVFALARRLTELAPWCRFNYRSLEAPTGFEQTQDFDDKMRRVQDFLRGSDVLVTCLDNVGSRVSGALAAKALGIVQIDGGVLGKRGQVLVTKFGESPCLGCLGINGSGRTSCMLSSTTCSGALIASLQAHLTIEHLHGRQVPAYVVADLESFQVKGVQVARNENCWICAS